MKKKTEIVEQEKQTEIKERIPLWLYPSTLAAIDNTIHQ